MITTSNYYCRPVEYYSSSFNNQMNTKETLKKLHEVFPGMSLDELFKILDCIVIDSVWNYPIYSTETTSTWANTNTNC